uniref:50S ribosomal protein L20 n=1 Tax=Gastroclonium compressum TaxID=1852973 RepID=A0A173G027_GASCM|nr:ribosomal protein L20 [Coeloseira compressa]ANH09634.1 ribosomal protein L20 [Coeloseira compressa]
MTRVKRGNIARKRRKKILKLAKGFRGSHSSLFRTAKQQVFKALKYSYVGRKNKKRDYRRLWILRINAAVRIHNITYSKFVQGLKKNNIALNRKMLSQLAILDKQAFNSILVTLH